jgi:hypothetical protein
MTLEQAIQLRRSPLGRVSFFVGLTGLNTMLLLVGWPSAQVPTPARFELIFLAASLLTAFLFGASRLWPSRPADELRGG